MLKSRMRWAGYVARMERGEVHLRFWWEKYGGQRSVGRILHRLQDNTKMDPKQGGLRA